MRENNVTSFVKRMTMSKEERVLRDAGLKDDCGEYTKEAEEIVINKLVDENKEMLVEVAEEMKKEEEKKRRREEEKKRRREEIERVYCDDLESTFCGFYN